MSSIVFGPAHIVMVVESFNCLKVCRYIHTFRERLYELLQFHPLRIRKLMLAYISLKNLKRLFLQPFLKIWCYQGYYLKLFLHFILANASKTSGSRPICILPSSIAKVAGCAPSSFIISSISFSHF